MKTIKRSSKPVIRSIQQLMIVLETYDMLLSAAWKVGTEESFILTPAPGKPTPTSNAMGRAVADFISSTGNGRELLAALASNYSNTSKVCILNGIIHVVIPCGNHLAAMQKTMKAQELELDMLVAEHISAINLTAYTKL
jgi:hypothetical protein